MFDNRSRTFICRISIVPVLALSASLSRADIRLGNLSIIPFAGVQETYDTNIYLTATNTESSLITIFFPGVNLYLPVRNNEFKLNYTAEFVGYSVNPSVNNTINNKIDLLTRFNFPVGLSLDANDYFLHTTEPLTSELAQRIERNQNRVYAKTGYTFSRFISTSLSFSQVLQDYIPEQYKQLLNRRENEIDLEIACTYSEKTSALVGFAYGTVDYSYVSNPNSSRYTQIDIGLRGELTPKTIGEIKVGGKERTYDDITGRDVTTPTLTLETTTDFSKKTHLNLFASRNFVESIYYNNLYYIENALRCLLIQKVYRDWTATFEGRYEFDAYPEEVTVNNETNKRQDTNILVGLGVSYAAMEWLFVSVNYIQRQRDSNFSLYNYLGNLIGINMKVLFY